MDIVALQLYMNVNQKAINSFCYLSRLPVEQRRNYSNVFNALYRMSKEEGVLTLWRVGISCVLNEVVPAIHQFTVITKPCANMVAAN